MSFYRRAKAPTNRFFVNLGCSMAYWNYTYGFPEGDDFYSPAFEGFGYTHVRYGGGNSLLHTDRTSRQVKRLNYDNLASFYL